MKIYPHLLLEYLNKKQLARAKFATLIDVPIEEVDKLLDGQAVEEPTARKFIYYFGAYKAHRFIDWNTIGKTNPLMEHDKKEI